MTNYEKFKHLLSELFQLDQADLDFGIYRIMNQKRDEIQRFLENDLLPQVKDSFRDYQTGDRVHLEQELKEAIQQAKELGADPETIPKAKELKKKLAGSVDVTALENEILSHLYNFFRRYYHEGDFLSLRRYKEGVYAIPYGGEEVKLHWANHDQYYIKTSEYFRDYTFKLPSGKRVHFKIAGADTEKDNTKAQSGKGRRFILCGENPVETVDDDLVIRFEYRPDSENRKQPEINAQTVSTVLKSGCLGQWLNEIALPKPTEKNPKRTLLEKHLTDYTARNTFDYFIHKDLGGFLRRELDFFIKNEVMRLDDIENETVPRVEQYLSKIKALRKIAHKIIAFLEQLENFQKKLWLKKKFVVETNYCVTLDRVPDELYPEIAANDAQRDEWVKLFAIDEIEGDLHLPAYSKPLSFEFLQANPFLVLDTRFFGNEFKDRLIASLENLDDQCDGLLIHGDNFQSLEFLQGTFKGLIHSVYSDPPYNTGNDGFTYKDRYQHSTWLQMFADRLDLLLSIATDTGSIACSIDENEMFRLQQTLDTFCPGLLGTVIIQNNPKGRFMDKNLSVSHEYLLIAALGPEASLFGLPKSKEAIARDFPEQDEISRYRWLELRNTHREFGRHNRPNLWYPLYACPRTGEVFVEQHTETNVVYPQWDDGFEGCWTWGRELASTQRKLLCGRNVRGRIKIFRKGRAVDDAGKPLVEQPKTIWLYPEVQTEKGQKVLDEMFGKNVFRAPKPPGLIQRWIHLSAPPGTWVLDCFAGSGTTGHACVDLCREESASRKYVLIEMGKPFYEVLLPRLKKAVYSKEWKSGKPVKRTGISHCLKYIRIESYEDSLNNLTLQRTDDQQKSLDQSGAFRESYTLSYMLDVESRGSASLLDIDSFEDPFDYKLDVAAGSAGETRPTVVDLVETFNYLLGLTVRHIDHIRGFRVVQGTSPAGENVLVIWRNLREKSNSDLDEFFRKQEYNPKDMEFDLIYVNGDNNLENLKRDDETWKVRLIEEDFHRLMFDVKDV